MSSLLKRLSAQLAESPLLRTGKSLWERNQTDWNLPLSKAQKLAAGLYIILRDHADGRFPPTFQDQQKAYQAEIDYNSNLPGLTPDSVMDANLRKPFWGQRIMERHLQDFCRLAGDLRRLGVAPGSRLLELGCGMGWMAEFFALLRYDVTGTSIAPGDIQAARSRASTLAARGLAVRLDFRVGPMESVHEVVADLPPFDAVFVYEALHHAFDWGQGLDASFRCLRPGGWFLLASEPNRVHTAVSYRVARLSNTHEIGFARGALLRRLRSAGFRDIRVLRHRLGLGVRTHWLAARRPA
jgi:SAM-dependent methyltransferase